MGLNPHRAFAVYPCRSTGSPDILEVDGCCGYSVDAENLRNVYALYPMTSVRLQAVLNAVDRQEHAELLRLLHGQPRIAVGMTLPVHVPTAPEDAPMRRRTDGEEELLDLLCIGEDLTEKRSGDVVREPVGRGVAPCAAHDVEFEVIRRGIVPAGL